MESRGQLSDHGLHPLRPRGDIVEEKMVARQLLDGKGELLAREPAGSAAS